MLLFVFFLQNALCQDLTVEAVLGVEHSPKTGSCTDYTLLDCPTDWGVYSPDCAEYGLPYATPYLCPTTYPLCVLNNSVCCPNGYPFACGKYCCPASAPRCSGTSCTLNSHNPVGQPAVTAGAKSYDIRCVTFAIDGGGFPPIDGIYFWEYTVSGGVRYYNGQLTSSDQGCWATIFGTGVSTSDGTIISLIGSFNCDSWTHVFTFSIDNQGNYGINGTALAWQPTQIPTPYSAIPSSCGEWFGPPPTTKKLMN